MTARASYPEIVDTLTQYGAQASADAAELFRRMAFNVLISNDDDHLRNHGFLWQNAKGWISSPAYDLNPVPVDLGRRILTTKISLEDGTCDINLVVEQAGYFALSVVEAKAIIKEVATATARWRAVAAAVGASKAEIDRMQSAFEHDDLKKALTF